MLLLTNVNVRSAILNLNSTVVELSRGFHIPIGGGSMKREVECHPEDEKSGLLK